MSQDHLQGKQYLGWKAIRDTLAAMQERMRSAPEPPRSRERERSRERDNERSRDREREREREYDRHAHRRACDGTGWPCAAAVAALLRVHASDFPIAALHASRAKLGSRGPGARASASAVALLAGMAAGGSKSGPVFARQRSFISVVARGSSTPRLDVVCC